MKLSDEEIVIRKHYNEIENIWDENDIWHTFTHKQINKAINSLLLPLIHKNQIILNAGSANTFYDFEDCYIYDCDIAESKLEKSKHPIVASIQNIPLNDHCIDIVICVGSVINYCDASKVISEFSRVMKPNSYLLLEFERSNSGEFLISSNYGKDVFSNYYTYNNQSHKLWMYSEKYISNLLTVYGFEIVKKRRFHILSSVISRFKDENYSAKFAKLDNFFKPVSYLLAHNVVFLIKKL